jgi:hypothetical protein
VETLDDDRGGDESQIYCDSEVDFQVKGTQLPLTGTIYDT